MYRVPTIPFYEVTDVGRRMQPNGYILMALTMIKNSFRQQSYLPQIGIKLQSLWNSTQRILSVKLMIPMVFKTDAMLTQDVLNSFDHLSVPSHQLLLKIGDICLMIRHLSKRYGLANNTRVRILQITQHSRRVQTLTDRPKSATSQEYVSNFVSLFESHMR
jgi:hypothetical protein